jgi:two-component system phosphate regulon sensor histidine kinase PhoR
MRLKKPSLTGISIMISLTCVIIISLFIFLSRATLQGEYFIHLLIITLIATFVITFLFSRYLISQFVYNRVKIIYDNVFRSREDIDNETDSNEDALYRAERRVSTWATEKQREIESLRSLENYRRNLLGDISHELKTPLFNIQGYVHTLLDGAMKNEKLNKKYLKRTAKNIERLNLIVDGLNTISRMESRRTPLEFQNFGIRSLSEELIDDLQLSTEEKEIRIFIPEDAIDYGVNANPEAVSQILSNLIMNSLKYGRDGGKTEINFIEVGDKVLVKVKDDGIGINEEDRKRIFDRFYRVEKSRSRHKGGSGLGLAIVKHLVEAHGQSVNVDSELGKGSVFSFTLAKAKE